MNYQSIPRRFNRPTSNINIQYIDQTLREKQGTIDSNYGFLSATVDQVLGQDLAREEDRAYLKNKVSSVMNSLEQTGSINFEDRKARFSIQDALSTAAKDPQILKQLANTKKVRQVQQFYQDRLKKGDINQGNFNYAYKKAGIDAYLKGTDENGNKIDDIGDFQYLEYSDVDAKMMELSTKLKAALPDDMITTMDPKTGQIIEKRISQVTPQEMQGHLRRQLDSNDLKQLEIDGATMYGMDDTVAIAARDEIIERKNKEYQAKIDDIQKKLNTNDTLTEGQREQEQSSLDAVKLQKSRFEQNMLAQKTAEKIGGQQLMDNRLNFYSNLFIKNRVISETYDKDILESLVKANSESQANTFGGANPNISTITTSTDLPEGVDIVADARETADTYRKNEVATINRAISSLPADKQELIKKKKEEIRNRPDVQKQFGNNPSSDTLTKLAIDEMGGSYFPANVRAEIEEARTQVVNINKKENEVTERFINTGTMNEETFDQVFNDETALTMSLPEGDINIKEYLVNNGVKDLDSYRTFIESGTPESKKFASTLALQTVNFTAGVLDRITNTPELSENASANILDDEYREKTLEYYKSFFRPLSEIDIDDRSYQIMRKAAKDIAGENLEDTYEIRKDGQSFNLKLKNPNSSFAKVLEQTKSNTDDGSMIDPISGAITSLFGLRDTDRTAANESAIASQFSEDKYDSFYKETLGTALSTIASNNLVRVQGAPKMEELDPAFVDIKRVASYANFDYKVPLDIYENPNKSLTVRQPIKSTVQTTNEDGEVVSKEVMSYNVATINPTDRAQMTNFNKYVESEKGKYSVETLSDLKSEAKNITFIGGDTNISNEANQRQIDGLNRLFNRNDPRENEFRMMASKTKSREILFSQENNQYLALYPEIANDIKSQFDDFQKNTHNYSLSVAKDVNDGYNVSILNEEGNVIGAIPLGENVPTDVFKKVFYGAPSAFLSMYTRKRIENYKSRVNRNAR